MTRQSNFRLPDYILPEANTVIGLDFVRELVETVILTGRVKGAEPCSLLLIAAPESGKTSIVLSKNCTNVEAFADITGRGVHMAIKSNKDLTHIIINDLVAVLSHRQSVNKYTMSVLNAMTEEGITQIATPAGIEKFDGGKKGVIASLTLDMAKDSRLWWNKIGFASRLLPFCYSYPYTMTIEIKDDIDQAILAGKPHKQQATTDFVTPKESVTVNYPADILRKVRRLADLISVNMKEQGFRRLKQFHSLVQAHAVLRNKRERSVTLSDLEWLENVALYISYDTARHLHAEPVPELQTR